MPKTRSVGGLTKRQTRKAKRTQKGGNGSGSGAPGSPSTNTKRAPYPGPSQCHPRVGKGTPGGGCFPQEVLEEAARNASLQAGGATSSQRQGRSQRQATTTTLLHRLAKHLAVDPKNQRSFLQALPLPEAKKKELADKWLRPPFPKHWTKGGEELWLDSNNIRDVMKQYQDSRPNFKFLGPYPIDFAAPDPYTKVGQAYMAPGGPPPGTPRDCLIDEMCELNLAEEAKKGIEHIGFVFNLDPHYKDGSHWVAAYINVRKKQCYYFDSYGMRPPKQIYKFMQWLTLQEPDMELGWNGRRFQRSDSECGMYSMYFLDRMMAGEPYLKFCRRAPPDYFMRDMRDWMFST